MKLKKNELKVVKKENLSKFIQENKSSTLVIFKFQKELDSWNVHFRADYARNTLLQSLFVVEVFDNSIQEPFVELYKPNTKIPKMLKSENFNMLTFWLKKNAIPLILKASEVQHYHEFGLTFIGVSYHERDEYKSRSGWIKKIAKSKRGLLQFFVYPNSESEDVPAHFVNICHSYPLSIVVVDSQLQNFKCFHGDSVDYASTVRWINRIISKQIIPMDSLSAIISQIENSTNDENPTTDSIENEFEKKKVLKNLTPSEKKEFIDEYKKGMESKK
jgi:hypothetical protein